MPSTVEADAFMARELARRRPIRLRYCPLRPTPKQIAWLWLDSFEAFYGGAAGGAKSVALLMAALQYVDVPGYAALLLRRTYPELVMDGGLIDMSHDWLHGTDAHWSGQEHKWTFPSGATLQFGHMASSQSHRRYQSFEGSFLGADELTHFEAYQWDFLTKCLRRPSSLRRLDASPDGLTLVDVPLRKRAASNPGSLGHEWVKARYVEPLTRVAGAVYLPARIADNKYIDRESYIASLMGMSGAERERMLEGDWDVTEKGDIFDTDAIQWIDRAPPSTRTIRRWDLAATAPSASNPDPDWTVGVKMARHRGGELYTLLDVQAFRHGPGKTQQLVRATAERDGRRVHQWIPQDPGQAGKDQKHNYAKILHGYVARGRTESGDKQTRAEPAAAAMENGTLRVLESISHKVEMLSQLRRFPGDGAHDDFVDAIAGAYNELSKGGSVRMSKTPRGRVGASAVTLTTVRR